MKHKVIFTVVGALVLFGGPFLSPAPAFAQGAAAPSCERLAA